MKEAVAYIDEHLQEEDLSIVSVARPYLPESGLFRKGFLRIHFHMDF